MIPPVLPQRYGLFWKTSLKNVSNVTRNSLIWTRLQNVVRKNVKTTKMEWRYNYFVKLNIFQSQNSDIIEHMTNECFIKHLKDHLKHFRTRSCHWSWTQWNTPSFSDITVLHGVLYVYIGVYGVLYINEVEKMFSAHLTRNILKFHIYDSYVAKTIGTILTLTQVCQICLKETECSTLSEQRPFWLFPT